MLDRFAILTLSLDGELAGTGNSEIRSLVLVAEGMAAHDDRIGSPGDQPRDVFDHDWLSIVDAAQDVSDGDFWRITLLLVV